MKCSEFVIGLSKLNVNGFYQQVVHLNSLYVENVFLLLIRTDDIETNVDALRFKV